MSDWPYIPSLGATESVRIGIGSLLVGCSTLGGLTNPISLHSGVMGLSCSVAEALALGDALIRIAHHYTAVVAEYQTSQGGAS